MKYVLIALLALGATGLVQLATSTPLQNSSDQPEVAKLASTEVVPETSGEDIVLLEATTLIEEWTDKLPAQASVVITNRNTNQSVETSHNSELIAASIYKIFVAYEVLLEEDASEEILAQTVISNYTVGECLRAMIVDSDEDCGIALGWLVGWENINEQLAKIGLANTDINNYNDDKSFNGDKKTTAADVDLFLEKLYNGELLSEASTSILLEHMLNQNINDRIPEVLPLGVTIAHKTGNLYDLVHDVGYITTRTGEAYSFVIMTSEWEEQEDAAPYFQALINDLAISIATGDNT